MKNLSSGQRISKFQKNAHKFVISISKMKISLKKKKTV